MSAVTLLVLLLIILLVAGLPSWPYSRAWGWTPSAVLTIVLVVLLVFILTGRL